MVIYMSDEEKKVFAEGMAGVAGKNIQMYEKKNKTNNIAFPSMCLVGLLFGAFLGVHFGIYATFYTVGCLGMWLLGWRSNVKQIDKIVKHFSNNKINYKQYKQLVKSGELNKWLSLDTKASNTQQTASNGGVALSAEEIAVLKKLVDKNVVTPEVTQNVTEPVQAPKNNDVDRNA